MTQYCVVYQTGGYANFKWHRSLAMSKDEAEKGCDETRRMGYVCHVVNHAQSLAIGLPDTFDSLNYCPLGLWCGSRV